VKRNKHDVADAEAICEAVRRPSMRFVPVKTVEQQSALMMHRARDLLIRQRTMLVNALRGHLAEFGLIEAQGLHKVARLIAIVMDEKDGRIPDIARQVLKVIVSHIEDIQTRIAGLERQVLEWHKNNPVSQRLATIPGIGPIIATAIAATVADPNIFRSGREFAACSCRDKTPPEARRGLGELANEGTVISVACLSTAHTRFCFVRSKPRPPPG
jgi:transposase